MYIKIQLVLGCRWTRKQARALYLSFQNGNNINSSNLFKKKILIVVIKEVLNLRDMNSYFIFIDGKIDLLPNL